MGKYTVKFEIVTENAVNGSKRHQAQIDSFTSSTPGAAVKSAIKKYYDTICKYATFGRLSVHVMDATGAILASAANLTINIFSSGALYIWHQDQNININPVI